MIRDEHWSEHPNEPVGPIFRQMIEAAYRSCSEDNDHYPFVTIGPTNSGKSNLNLWVYEIIHPDPQIWRVVWTKDEFARAQARVAKEPMPRFIMYDELDAESKEAMTAWNRQFKRLFDKVRYSNIMWALCNPSANYLDKSLIIDEVIKAVFVIRDKSKTGAREVLVYTQQDLSRMLDDGLQLKLKVLRSIDTAEKYAYLRTWFRRYNGVLEAEYEAKKAARTSDIHDMFAEAFGTGKTYTLSKAAKIIGVHRDTLRPVVVKAIKEGAVSEQSITGQHRLNEMDIDELKRRLTSD